MATALTCRYDTGVALSYRQAGETVVIKGYEKLWRTAGKLAQLCYSHIEQRVTIYKLHALDVSRWLPRRCLVVTIAESWL